MKRCFTVRSLLLALASIYCSGQAQTPVDLGTVQVSQIGHVFQTNTPPFPNLVYDYFIDQRQQSGGGVLPPVTVDWSTNHEFVLTISAPPGDMFLIQPPVLRSGKFSGSLWWTNGISGGGSWGTVKVSMVTLQGVPPDFSQSSCFSSDSYDIFGFANIDSAPFTREIAFTSMVITGTAAPQPSAEGAKVFTPDAISWLAFVSVGPQSGDPGPSVSIVPFGYRVSAPFIIVPTLNFTADQQDNFVVTFDGVLQWSPEPGGPFSDVPGHPLGAFAVPKSGFFQQRFFRVRYNN